jgi:methionine-S-sulfoxide reductase
MPRLTVLLISALALTAARCAGPEATGTPEATTGPAATAPGAPAAYHDPERSNLRLDPAAADTVVFAMGCFWCAETAFEGMAGVAAVASGFAGGTVANPTYDQVTAGGTGHYESVEVVYDPATVDYATLLRVFWHNVDPVDAGGQFCDRGDSYRSAIFARTPAQRRLAEASKAELAASGRFDGTIVTEILPAAPFYLAEDYHQDFWLKDPERYHSYRTGCRRDARLDALWGERARVSAGAL